MCRSDLKVCIVQADLKWQDKDQNLQMFNRLIDGYGGVADLIILPEMFSTGFSMNPETLAEEINGQTTAWMINKAKQLHAAIVGSVIIEESGSYYNRLLFVKPSGEVAVYNKRHLFRLGNEHLKYKKGVERIVVEYKGWKICPLICYDLRFPVWSRNVDDFDLLLYLANWPDARRHAWKTLLLARAVENQCYVVGVNRIGKDANGLIYSGDSMSIDPEGNPMLIMESNTPQAVLITLSKLQLTEYREKFPVLLDRDQFEMNI